MARKLPALAAPEEAALPFRMPGAEEVAVRFLVRQDFVRPTAAKVRKAAESKIHRCVWSVWQERQESAQDRAPQREPDSTPFLTR
jgi:hypothetical protein